MPGPNLESIESDASTDSTDDKLFGVIRNVIYKATSQAFQEYENALKRFGKDQKSSKQSSYVFLPLWP